MAQAFSLTDKLKSSNKTESKAVSLVDYVPKKVDLRDPLGMNKVLAGATQKPKRDMSNDVISAAPEKKLSPAGKLISKLPEKLSDPLLNFGRELNDFLVPSFSTQMNRALEENPKATPDELAARVKELDNEYGILRKSDGTGISFDPEAVVGSLRSIVKRLAKETSEDVIKRILRTDVKVLSKEAVDTTARRIASEKSEEGVSRLLREAVGTKKLSQTSGSFDIRNKGPRLSKSIPEGSVSKNGVDLTRKLNVVPDGGVPKRSVIPRQTTPKIEQRFVRNFPELGSADNIAQIRTRTRGSITNRESFEAAQRLGYTEDRILNIPVGKALNAEEKLAVSGITERSRLVLKQLEDNLSQLAPDSTEAADLRLVVAKQKVKTYQLMAVERGVAAEAGRALQAHKATIKGIKQEERWLSKYLADPKTPQNLKDYIYKRVGQFNGEPSELRSLLRELHQASVMDMLVEFATAVKLWAIPTHIVNTVSSLARMVLNIPLNGLSGAIDGILSKLRGRQRERFIADAQSEMLGQMLGWKHAGHEAAKALADENYAFEARKLQDFNPKGPAIKGRPGKDTKLDRSLDVFGKGVRVPFRLLGVEDMLIRTPSRQGALYTLIGRDLRKRGLKPGTKEWSEEFAKSIDNPSLEFIENIEKMADENLFQESLHPYMKVLENLRHEIPALKFIVPFFRTIVNLQKQAIEFSPAAPILPSVRKSLATPGASSDAIAKMTLGTAVMIPLTYQALEGNITLAAPTNPSERDKFYADGKQAYSVRIGDKWYPYHRFSPYSEWFVYAAALGEAVNNEDEKTQGELAAHVFFTLTQNFFDKSFATGMNDFLDALANPDRADNWVQNFATGLIVPTIVSGAARSIDPVFRETESIKDAFLSKIPWASRGLPAKRDVFGEELVRPGNAVSRFLSPVIPSPVEVNMVREELEDIGVQIGFPGDTAGGYEMDEETYRTFKAVSGKLIYHALFQMMQNPGYQELAPRQREKAVDKIVRDVRDAVKSQVAQEQLIMQQIKTQLKNQGYSTSQADELAEKVYTRIKASGGTDTQ